MNVAEGERAERVLDGLWDWCRVFCGISAARRVLRGCQRVKLPRGRDARRGDECGRRMGRAGVNDRHTASSSKMDERHAERLFCSSTG